jgi:hypothetical protein
MPRKGRVYALIRVVFVAGRRAQLCCLLVEAEASLRPFREQM